MRQERICFWSSLIFGIVSSLGVIGLCVDTLFRLNQSAWLLPAIILGSALFLSVPSTFLLIWGVRILKGTPIEQRARMKVAIGFAASPIVVSAVGLILGFFIIFVFGFKMPG